MASKRAGANTGYQSAIEDAMRLDVWLFRTRLVKSRALAAQLIQKGKVRISRSGTTERVTRPGARIRPGDQLGFMRGAALIQVQMLSAPPRRGPAAEAQKCYLLLPIDGK